MKEVKEFKHLKMEGEIEREREREGSIKGRYVIGLFARIIRGRNVSMEVKKGLRNSILLPTLTYGSDLGRGIGHSSQECAVWCGNELSERRMWRDKMGG